jgi:flagellar M-ring protein FliF
MAEVTLVQRNILDTVPGLRQLVLLVGVAAAVAAAVWFVFWSQGGSYTTLYSQLSDRDAAAVRDALTAAGIENRIDPATGAVMVADDKLREARMSLATQGLPQGDGLGVEMLQQDPALGTSQFMETARYQLALETELARTIVKVQGVQGARVHLALPKSSVFLRDRRPPSASVLLQLYPGRRLDPGQVAAVVHLVASSVPELEAQQVTVVDQTGKLLSSAGDGDEMSASAKQLEFQREVEDRYRRRIEDLLTPLVGAGAVRAGVTADIDFTVTERTAEDFDPQQQVVRSEQTSTDQRLAGDVAQGIPGALSNQPPQTTPAPPAAQQQPAQNPAQPVATSERATRNFEIDRVISHTRVPFGEVRRLNVAVIVDNRAAAAPAPAAAGAPAPTPAAPKPYTDEELARFTTIVKEAVGFDSQRGDSVEVVNAPFTARPDVAAAEAAPFWESPLLRSIGRQGIALAMVALLAFVVVRPLMRSLMRVPVPVAPPAELAGDRVSLSGPGAGTAAQPEAAQSPFDQQVSNARSLVGRDPRRAADVVKEWVMADG